jgi:hypothetical protein
MTLRIFAKRLFKQEPLALRIAGPEIPAMDQECERGERRKEYGANYRHQKP